jgi:(S)-3,5-dihydroxyphenylglycine transaminase
MRAVLADPALQVMGFLNEIVLRYPHAVSFAPGRPSEALFDARASVDEIDRYVDHRAAQSGRPRRAIVDTLGQYGPSRGIITDLVAAHLRADERIDCAEDTIVVTNGAQEAMTLVLLALFEPGRDVLLVGEPNYIGITGMAAILGIQVVPVSADDDGTDLAELERAVDRIRRDGKRPRAFYDIPDFHNPLGTRMPLDARRRLLGLAERHSLLLIEDNAYGMFAYDGVRMPTLRALDVASRVIYLGTFSKTLYPGLRVGYAILPDRAQAEALATVKSLTSVNTSPLLQAVVGGSLLRSDGSLAEVCRAKVSFYRNNRDRMLRALERELAGAATWNEPAGGFFVTVALPFDFGDAELVRCAQDYRVVVAPMAYFSLTGGRRRQIRLSFSYVSEAQIDEGVARLAAFVRDEVERAR